MRTDPPSPSPRRLPLPWSAAACVALAALLCGCWPDSSGIDPPADRFFYPTGMALDPGGRYLYVANSNFDLRYNAGTVVVVDLERVDETIRGCSGRCREPRDEGGLLVEGSTVVIGSQVTDITAAVDGARLYAAVRGNASLTWIDVAADAGPDGRILSCGDDGAPGAQRCDGRHEVIRTGDLWMPAEPYAILADEEWVLTGHVDSGRVAVFDVSDAERAPELVRVLDIFPEGVNGLTRQPGSDWLWLVSRDSSRLYPFLIAMPGRQAGEGPAVATGASIHLGVNDPGTDCRSIAFSPDGDRAFVTNRAPPSLIVVDTSRRPDGGVDGTVLATIELPGGPSRLAVLPFEDGGYVVLAVCFDAEAVVTIDPDLRMVVDAQRVGMGPHAILAHPETQRVYLANFAESTVWVLDFNPRSPNYGQPVLSIGQPEPPEGHD